ncbi:hypothetical protein K239x_47330 [Planctomycetes bacterium K23_9]|uniref:Uncharacterized protein n=1 Tax=Stieleria marina TaxID=1930275 RepID=A0A517P030_9BACT|nr:hypothetical protein K239x_47330 [Planctomycetes bacterium K23_9]
MSDSICAAVSFASGRACEQNGETQPMALATGPEKASVRDARPAAGAVGSQLDRSSPFHGTRQYLKSLK